MRPGRLLRGCTLLPHLTVGTKRKGETGALESVFVFEKTALWQLEETLEVNETGLVGSRNSIARNEVQRGLLYTR